MSEKQSLVDTIRRRFASATKSLSEAVYDENKVMNEELDKEFQLGLSGTPLRKEEIGQLEEAWKSAVDETDKKQVLKLFRRKEVVAYKRA